MDTESKIELINKPPTEEILTPTDLKQRIETGNLKNHYIGFEISGKLHLGQGLLSAMKIVDLQKIGMNTTIFLADWHAWINNKLNSDWDLIKKASKYYEDSFKACIKALGGKPEKTKYLLGSELYHNNDEYWQRLFDISKKINLTQAMKGIDIAGRKMKNEVPLAIMMYPPLQVNDIFEMKIDLAHSGTDQRKAHVIAREVAKKLSLKKYEKPIALHHHLLTGLSTPKTIPKNLTREMLVEMKMSKSKPDSAIFLDDENKEIEKKVKKGFCPEKNTDFNPVLEWAQYLILGNKDLKIERPTKFGGDLIYYDIEHLKKDFKKGNLHPLDLKNSMTKELQTLITPIREKIKKSKHSKIFNKIKITR